MAVIVKFACVIFFSKTKDVPKTAAGSPRSFAGQIHVGFQFIKNTSLKFEKLHYYLYLELYHEIK